MQSVYDCILGGGGEGKVSKHERKLIYKVPTMASCARGGMGYIMHEELGRMCGVPGASMMGWCVCVLGVVGRSEWLGIDLKPVAGGRVEELQRAPRTAQVRALA